MATALKVFENYVNADTSYETTPANYIELDLTNDYNIWTEGDATVKDLMTHEPTAGELNTAATKIDPSNPKTVAKCLLMDKSHDVGGSYYIPHAIGTSKALELIFTGKLIDAAEAERLGIVSQVVPPDELMKVVKELATEIAKQPPVALELAKKIVWRGEIDVIAHQLDLETYAQRICFLTEDHKEAVSAFMEKRPQPQFKGR